MRPPSRDDLLEARYAASDIAEKAGAVLRVAAGDYGLLPHTAKQIDPDKNLCDCIAKLCWVLENEYGKIPAVEELLLCVANGDVAEGDMVRRLAHLLAWDHGRDLWQSIVNTIREVEPDGLKMDPSTTMRFRLDWLV